MLRMFYDDFDQKVKNIHDEMDLHHSYKKKKACMWFLDLFSSLLSLNIRMGTEESVNIYWPFCHLAPR